MRLTCSIQHTHLFIFPLRLSSAPCRCNACARSTTLYCVCSHTAIVIALPGARTRVCVYVCRCGQRRFLNFYDYFIVSVQIKRIHTRLVHVRTVHT